MKQNTHTGFWHEVINIINLHWRGNMLSIKFEYYRVTIYLNSIKIIWKLLLEVKWSRCLCLKSRRISTKLWTSRWYHTHMFLSPIIEALGKQRGDNACLHSLCWVSTLRKLWNSIKNVTVWYWNQTTASLLLSLSNDFQNKLHTLPTVRQRFWSYMVLGSKSWPEISFSINLGIVRCERNISL